VRPWKRIRMNLLLLPNVALAITIVVTGLGLAIERFNGVSMGRMPITWPAILDSLVLYYVLVLIPSVLFTVAMEWIYRRGLKPKSKTAVAVSTACGSAAWLILSELANMNLYMGGAMLRRRDEAISLLGFMAIGALTGLIVGLLVRLAEHHALKKAAIT